MSSLPPLSHRFLDELPELATPWTASQVDAPQLVALNDTLAAELGFDTDWLRSEDGVAFLTGTAVPDGVHPSAMVYAGHQFGSYSPRLGDGRALLLGEAVDGSGNLVDLHVKGSGRTPFARGGDGKATLGPMLREYLMCEAVSALGVPTTRALAVVATGEEVLRQNGPEPGAVFVRAAASHLRVGTFEYAARLDRADVLVRLADHAIARHYPAVADSDDHYLALLEAVVSAQASLIADWMSLGFIHGVMNTDNTTISGETIDYGPCAFMDRFDPATVFSSIDHGGRYAYGNQPRIMSWNLARLAETLLPLIADDQELAVNRATEALKGFGPAFEAAWQQRLLGKLGLDAAAGGPTADDIAIAARFVEIMQAEHLDWTSTFRSLSGLAQRPAAHDTDATHLYSGGLAQWAETWRSRLAEGHDGPDADGAASAARLDAANPLYVPRNHLVEAALGEAVRGDLSEFERLLELVTSPFAEQPDAQAYTEPAPEEFTAGHRTFCGT